MTTAHDDAPPVGRPPGRAARVVAARPRRRAQAAGDRSGGARAQLLTVVAMSALCAAPGLSARAAAPSASAPAIEGATAREWHTAQCVAALDASTVLLAQRVREGRDDLRAQLRGRLESGIALIGDAYLGGERDEQRSKALLVSAREAQRTLPEDALAARQSTCAEEGTRLLSAANAIERAVVSMLAERRMKKLLAPPRPPGAASSPR